MPRVLPVNLPKPMNYIDSDIRPWGSWEEYLNEDGYRVKRIIVSPGARLSLQRHELRSEHWVVARGTGVLWLDGEKVKIQAGDYAFIPVRGIHRLENTGEFDMIVIETQIGICDEDDIERLEDDYGRV